MPIVFVHGAGTRTYYRRYDVDWEHVEQHLRHYVAPVIAPDPENVAITLAYWGDLGVKLAWDGASIPEARMFSMYNHPLTSLIRTGRKRHIMMESWNRMAALAGHYLSRIVSLFRRPHFMQTTTFIGDAFHYLAVRGLAPQPGPIPARVLAALAEARRNQQSRNGEPLIVLSHSLGGLILYDIFTHFLPHMPAYAGIHVNFWTSISTQIGVFEEMKLFIASDARYGPDHPVPFPDRRFLSAWWNVWDSHDFLSFSVRGIIDGVDDEYFNSGLSVAGAHLACLKMSSFYTLFAEKLRKVV
ncbi:MAG: hypothetical protein KDI79_01180 [Anaerolineae bacterium]|nr:hypothetical protein [Anaerolineae bacterium]